MKVLVLAVSLAPLMATAADRVGDFSLLDQNGYFHQMSWYDDHAAIALLVQANGSEASTAAMNEFSALQSRYESSGIEFFMINPVDQQNREAVIAELAKNGIDMRVLMDDTQLISESLGIEKTGEVLVYNPKSFTVEFRGSLGNDFTAALDAVIAGKAVTNSQLATTGDTITYAAKAAHSQSLPSYEKDIAPIIVDNCATCHREGGIAPFSMDSHAMVQGWSPMIREVLMTKRMPPGQIDGHIGEFINDRLVDNSDQQKLLHWIEAGAPKDGEVDPLTLLTWSKSKWTLGDTPDYIIEVPEQHVPATGVLAYRDVSIPINLGGKDRWLKGSEYVPGDRTVLHHTINSLNYPEEIGKRINPLGGGSADKASITAYVPGVTVAFEPPNTGGLLKDGSVLNLNLHYTTNGRETIDRSEIGLWFYPEDEVPSDRMSGQCACIFPNTWTNIPAGDPNFEQVSTITIPKDANIHSFLPHMHFRGKYMRFYADYPDGSKECSLTEGISHHTS
jgi:peroxiredoxin